MKTSKKQQPSNRQIAADALRKKPGTTYADLLAAYPDRFPNGKAAQNALYGARLSLNGHAPEPPQKAAKPRKSPKVQLCLTVPDVGAELKLNGLGGMIGTLHISRDGLRFVRAKGKSMPERELTWRVLERLADIGL